MLQEWKKDLASVNPKAADALADPEDYPNLFPGLQVRLWRMPAAYDPMLFVPLSGAGYCCCVCTVLTVRSDDVPFRLTVSAVLCCSVYCSAAEGLSAAPITVCATVGDAVCI